MNNLFHTREAPSEVECEFLMTTTIVVEAVFYWCHKALNILR